MKEPYQATPEITKLAIIDLWTELILKMLNNADFMSIRLVSRWFANITQPLILERLKLPLKIQDDCVLLPLKQSFYFWGHENRLVRETQKRLNPPIEIKFPEKITSFVTNGSSAFCITDMNNIFVIGSNNHYQLGLEHNKTVRQPTMLTLPENKKAKQIIIEQDSIYCITDDNKLMTWGDNFMNQLGYPFENENHAPNTVDLNGEAVKKIVPNNGGIACITQTNRVLTWGNNACAQLGLGHTDDQPIPEYITIDEAIVDLIPGYHSMFAITSKKDLLSWGKNSDGQLGLGHTNQQMTPHTVDLGGKNVTQIIFSNSSTYCLTEDNLLFVWGNNDYGQLGLGDKNTRTSPHPLSFPDNEQPIELSVNRNSVLCRMKSRNVFSWGRNHYGQLGIGNNKEVLSPKKVILPNQAMVSLIINDRYSTFFLTKNRRLITCGDNRFGQIGLGNRQAETTPEIVSLPNNERVLQLFTNGNSTLCLTQKFNIYVFGNNCFAQLGVNSSETILQPKKSPSFENILALKFRLLQLSTLSLDKPIQTNESPFQLFQQNVSQLSVSDTDSCAEGYTTNPGSIGY